MIAFGVNLLNGFLTNLPSLATESPADVTCLPSETRFVQSRDSRVASKVSIRAYSIRKVLDNILMIVELSLSVSSAAVTAATGPEVKVIIAACGRYAKTNMKVVTPKLRVRVGVNFEARGFHNSLCEMKYRIP
jgi:hypothetical protein